MSQEDANVIKDNITSVVCKKKKKKRKRQYGENGVVDDDKIEEAKNIQDHLKQTLIEEHDDKSTTTPTGDGVNGESEEWSVPKKKKKQKNLVPSFECDLDALFASYGKRAQGSHIKMSEVRSLYMLTINGNNGCLPTWCRLNAFKQIKKTLLLSLGHVSQQDYIDYKDCFPYLNAAFDKCIPVRHDGSEYSIRSPTEALLNYRMTKRMQEQKRIEKNQAHCGSKEFFEYCLTDEQLVTNEYPQWNPAAREHGVRSTREKEGRQKPDKESKLFALDCEMCNAAGNEQVLTRISVVDSNLETIYDTLVQPDVPITDYVTQFSGITAEMLEGVTTRLCDVQDKLLELIQPQHILVGHSLDFDLRVLKLHHDNIVDTSVLYVDQRGPRYKSSLKNLVKNYLNRDIQNSQGGHCSIEDAKSCMELVQLKIKKGGLFGHPDQENESIFEALHREGKKGAVIDSAHIVRQHCFGSVHSVPCVTDDEVVKNAVRFYKTVDFTFAHLKMYENFVKNNNTSADPISTEKKRELFKALDKCVSNILSVEHPDSLIVVSLSGGYVPPAIMEMTRDKEKRKSEEVRNALRTAKNCVCFVKVTPPPPPSI